MREGNSVQGVDMEGHVLMCEKKNIVGKKIENDGELDLSQVLKAIKRFLY